jgi:acyl dehydratase
MAADLLDVAVGTKLPPIAFDAISRTELAMFAGASGDHNPIHLDTDVARSAGLDDVFAQGMLSMAYLSRLLLEWAPQQQLREFGVRFTAITPVHGAPTATGTVTAVGTVDGERRVTVEVTMALTDGRVTLVGDAQVALG